MLPAFNVKCKKKSSAWWIFLIGLFSMTQVRLGAKIGISELAMLVIGPFLFFVDYKQLKHNGLLTLIKFLGLWFVGALISDIYNDSNVYQFLRGVTVPIVVFVTIVTIHHFLKDDVQNYKWLLFGIACSSVLSVFVFQRGSAGDLSAAGDSAAAIESVVGYKLFWVHMCRTWIELPIQIWYLKIPFVYTMFSVVVVALLAAFSGGRSSFLVGMMSLAVIVCARKKVATMMLIRKYFIIIILFMVGIVAGVKFGYKYAAEHGYLSEYEEKKYRHQTDQGSGLINLLMNGRSEFFIDIIAAMDRPLFGHGSWALDYNGYADDFVMKYGTDMDRAMISNQRDEVGLHIIPFHSHIATYLMWHGFLSLFFWLYIMLNAWTLFRKNLSVVPSMFGYFALAIPKFFWDCLFSPFGVRTGECLLYILILMVNKQAKVLRLGGK